MVKVGKVRLHDPGRCYVFRSVGIDLEVKDKCIVKTDSGLEFGEVVEAPKVAVSEELAQRMMKVVRKATSEDIRNHAELKKLEREAFKVCATKIEERDLPMKLIAVEGTFDRRRIVFYFRSETRVDFRELVKDLAHVFKTRIELRQIGVRDEARILGGLGCCGRALCCITFLGDFEPISIKMAKRQKLALNPAKISGLCGRLMCCIQFEHAVYQAREAEASKANKAAPEMEAGESEENNPSCPRNNGGGRNGEACGGSCPGS